MQADEMEKVYVISPPDESKASRLLDTIAPVAHLRQGARFWVVEPQDLRSIDGALSGYTLERLFESFFILYGRSADAARQYLIEALFNDLADRYEEIIQVLRNVENIHTLVGLIRKHGPPWTESTRVLDFGCGSGLSATIALLEGAELVGYDLSDRMVELAEIRGLEAWGPESFMEAKDGTFDFAICSYVLHLGVPLRDYRQIYQILSPGGLMAANLHKGKRLQSVRTKARTSGFSELEVCSPQTRFDHGQYLLFQRRRQ